MACAGEKEKDNNPILILHGDPVENGKADNHSVPPNPSGLHTVNKMLFSSG